MPKRKQSLNDRDKVNYLLSRARTVLSMRFIPIQSYAAASSKSDVIRNYMLLKVEIESVEGLSRIVCKRQNCVER